MQRVIVGEPNFEKLPIYSLTND
eukprot:UN09977